MDQEKIGKFIKDIRKQNNLTQAEFAKKYDVTYQAVSKWETGKNIPDIALIKQMSKDFNIDISDILNGEIKEKRPKKNTYKIILILTIVILILISLVLILYFNKDNSFNFKTLESNCKEFNISGSLAYNKNKSSIYISDVNYCGGTDETIYKNIQCTLFEKNKNTNIKIDTYNSNDKEIMLDDFLKKVKFNIDDYSSTCKNYKENSLYLEINATTLNNKTITYNIPLTILENCK